jgi:dolichol-phosphate mannosyltransferase
MTASCSQPAAADFAITAPAITTMPAKPAHSTLVTLATYNEIDNLPRLVDEIFATLEGVNILVVDDNSPDGTGRWCDERAAIDSRLHCIHRAGKLGLGTATIAGLRYAIEHGYAYVLNMDADFSHQPRYLKAIRAGMERPDGTPGADVMIGSRYIPGGGVEGWPLKRHIMSRGINVFSRLMLGLKPKDCSGAYRCYRTSVLAKVDFDAIQSRGYSFQEEILWHLKRAGAKFAETPIIFPDRVRGASKIDSGEAFNALAILARLGMRNWLGR